MDKPVRINCGGKMSGLHIKIKKEAVARVAFNEAAQQTIIELKPDASCHVLTASGRLASLTFLGASIPVEGSPSEINKKLGFSV